MPVHLVARSRELRRLDRLAAVTMVEALPGMGRSTLVAAWAREQSGRGARVVWVRPASDVDPPEAVVHRLRVGLLRTDGSGSAVIIVVDDPRLVRDPAVPDALARIAAAAHHVHVVVCCEDGRGFREAAERHGLETNVLRGTDLCVTAAQIPAFAAAWGHRVTDTSAARLHELIGGWLLPLRLVLDATPPWSDAFATHVADEFLTDRVLPTIADTAELSVAMRLAVPTVLDPDLADALVDRGSLPGPRPSTWPAAAAALEQRGLLWRAPRDDLAPAWRFPTLVRRALLDRLERTDPNAASAAHQVVAHVLAGRGDADAGDLLRHARAAGDWSLLAALWDRRGWSLAGADARAFEVAYGKLPVAAVAEFDSLSIAGSLGDALASLSDDADWMRRVETLLHHYTQAGTDFLRFPQQVQEPFRRADLLAAAMIAKRSEGILEDANRLAAEATRELARARLADPGRARTSQEAWFSLQHAITQLGIGSYSPALELATLAHRMDPESLVGAGAAGLVGAMHAISGQSDDARHWIALHEAVDVSGHWAADLTRLPARIGRAMLALDDLDAERAGGELAEVPLGPEAVGLWPLVLAVHTRYALMFGDPVAMLPRLDHAGRVLARHLRHSDGAGRQVFDRCSVELTMALGEVNRVHGRLAEGHELPPWLLTPAARFHLITGDHRRAVRITSAGTWRRDVHVRDRTQLLVIKALAHRSLGEHERSLEVFRDAHALVLDTRNLEPMLLIPHDVRRSLLSATDLHLDAAVLTRLEATPRIYPEHAELIQLSPRELEVVRQIRHHQTTAGLARSLSVSVNTVKKQLVSLYAKLDVHDRSSALLRAERLGFLDESREPARRP